MGPGQAAESPVASGEGATGKTEFLQKSEERMVEKLCDMRLTEMFLRRSQHCLGGIYSADVIVLAEALKHPVLTLMHAA